MPSPIYVTAAVEGPVDEAVVHKLIEHVGCVPGPVYGKKGKPALRSSIRGFNQAARRGPWIVLVDLDRDHECAPPLREAWVPVAAPHLCFRVAVRAIEAWLIADDDALARFLRIARDRIPRAPESLPDPKGALVDLARASRQRAIREDMVPRGSSGRSVGPAYTSRVIEYVQREWRPEIAAARADSLQRAIACLNGLVEGPASPRGGRDLFS
jgi:hypothetical protein